MIRAVLDSDVLTGCLLRAANVHASIRRLWLDGNFHLCTSIPIIAELTEVLADRRLRRKIDPNLSEEADFIQRLSTGADFPSLELRVEPVILNGHEANIVLATAWATKADCIVTGDAHLLELGSHVGIPIFSPRDFLENLMHDQGSDLP